MKAVLDTNVLVSGLIWRGVPYRCLLAAKAGLFELVLSDEILSELGRVLREKFRLSEDEAAESVKLTREMGRIVEVTATIKAVAQDPEDDKFLEAAVSAGAGFIVSGDHHLLELGEYQDIKIIKAKEFLDLVLKETEEA